MYMIVVTGIKYLRPSRPKGANKSNLRIILNKYCTNDNVLTSIIQNNYYILYMMLYLPLYKIILLLLLLLLPLYRKYIIAIVREFRTTSIVLRSIVQTITKCCCVIAGVFVWYILCYDNYVGFVIL